MKFDLHFTIVGPVKPDGVEVPNNTNPVEAGSLANLLVRLAQNLPDNPSLGVEVVGVRVRRVDA